MHHWHGSDWRPNSRYLDTEDVPTGQVGPGNPVATPACLKGKTPLLESDYYFGDYDIDLDCPISHCEVILSEDHPALRSDQVLTEPWTPIASTLRLSHQDVLDPGGTAIHPRPNFLLSQSHFSIPLCLGHTPSGELKSSGKENNVPDNVSPESPPPENNTCVDHFEHRLSLEGTHCEEETSSSDLQLQTEV